MGALGVKRGGPSRLAGETVTLASVRFSSVTVEPGRDPERALLSRLVGEAVTLASVWFSPIIVEPGRDSLDLMHGQSVVMQGDFLCKNCEGVG